MAVEKVGEKYKCNVCGNEVVLTYYYGSGRLWGKAKYDFEEALN